jgi:hypothetical protein|tara:strand:+ start:340 stop:933 length:594 start_codon:yes stop_codon:yes gene_type:complete
MRKSLSSAQRKKFFPELCERDNGFKCYYCKCKLESNHFVFDHLNENPQDNRIDNLVLACQSCNVSRITDGELHERGLEKLEENEKTMFVREKIDSSESIISKEIDINQKNTRITEKFVSSLIDETGSVLYSEVLDACVFLCQKHSGHGSHQSVRNYLASLTSIVGPFKETRNEQNKRTIVKRKEEEKFKEKIEFENE